MSSPFIKMNLVGFRHYRCCQGSKKLQPRRAAPRLNLRSLCSLFRKGCLRCVVVVIVLLHLLLHLLFHLRLAVVMFAVASVIERRKPVRMRGCRKARALLR